MSLLGASIVGGVAGIAGGLMQNDANARMARRQMDFQERMDNTKYQRMVADMQKAGLNPALAYTQGAGSAPAGAMAQMENPLKGVSGEISAYHARQQMQAQTTNALKQNSLMDAQMDNLKDQNFKLQAETAETNARTIRLMQMLPEEIRAMKSSNFSSFTRGFGDQFGDKVKEFSGNPLAFSLDVATNAKDKFIDAPALWVADKFKESVSSATSKNVERKKRIDSKRKERRIDKNTVNKGMPYFKGW